MLISSLTCVQLMITHRHTFLAAFKFARIPIFIFLCLYFGLIFVTKDTSVFNAGIGEILLMFLVGYIVGPTAALDYILQHRPDYAVGSNHTFKFFLSIFSHLGLVAYQPPPQDNFIFVPLFRRMCSPSTAITSTILACTGSDGDGSDRFAANIGLSQSPFRQQAGDIFLCHHLV